jgi:ParB/Sulfiredoxin domain
MITAAMSRRAALAVNRLRLDLDSRDRVFHASVQARDDAEFTTLTAGLLPVLAAWKEALHPRDERGRFGHKTGLPATLTGTDYAGETGNLDHITRNETGLIPTSAVARLPGVNGEKPGEHRNYKGQRWEDFKRDIAEHGIQSPIFITVDYGQEPKISEGNQRRDAAVELGLETVPVEIRYFGHAEQQGTVLDRHTTGPDVLPGGTALKMGRVKWAQAEGHTRFRAHYTGQDDQYSYDVLRTGDSAWQLRIYDKTQGGRVVHDATFRRWTLVREFVDGWRGPDQKLALPGETGISDMDAIRWLADEDRTASPPVSNRLNLAMDRLRYGDRPGAAAHVEEAAFLADTMDNNTRQARLLREIRDQLALPAAAEPPPPPPVKRRVPPPPMGNNRSLAAWLGKYVVPQTHQVTLDLYGTIRHRFNGKVSVEERPKFAGIMYWNGRMGLDGRSARDIADAFHPDPTRRANPYGVQVLFHEETHSAGFSGLILAENRDYVTGSGQAQEEGFTELGAWLRFGEFIDAAGIGDRPTPFPVGGGDVPDRNRIEEEISGRLLNTSRLLNDAIRLQLIPDDKAARLVPVIDQLTVTRQLWKARAPQGDAALEQAIRMLNDAGEFNAAQALARYRTQLNTMQPAEYETFAQYAKRAVTWDRIDGYVSYQGWTATAQAWCETIAQAEAGMAGDHSGTPESRWPRVKQVAAEINAQSGGILKRQVMAKQLLAALGFPDEVIETGRGTSRRWQGRLSVLVAGWINDGWLKQGTGDAWKEANPDPAAVALAGLRKLQASGDLPDTPILLAAGGGVR